MAKGKPSDERVNQLQRHLTGAHVGGQWGWQARRDAQQLIYIEESATDLLAGIKRLETAKTVEERDSVLREIKQELHFLRTLANEKAFLRDVIG